MKAFVCASDKPKIPPADFPPPPAFPPISTRSVVADDSGSAGGPGCGATAGFGTSGAVAGFGTSGAVAPMNALNLPALAAYSSWFFFAASRSFSLNFSSVARLAKCASCSRMIFSESGAPSRANCFMASVCISLPLATRLAVFIAIRLRSSGLSFACETALFSSAIFLPNSVSGASFSTSANTPSFIVVVRGMMACA